MTVFHNSDGSMWTGRAERCGKGARFREPVDNSSMNIVPRLISIALRRYDSDGAEQVPAARMILCNAVRLALRHLGAEQTETLVRDVIRGPVH